MSESKRKIEAGTHVVNVKKWGFKETQAGNLQVFISFSNNTTMFQNINSNDIGDKILSEALVLCGFKGNDLADLLKDDALDKDNAVEIYVQYKPHHEDDTKEVMQVSVNNPNKGQMKGELDRSSALSKLKELKLSLKSELKQTKTEIEVVKIDKKEVKKEKEVESSDFDEDDIPF